MFPNNGIVGMVVGYIELWIEANFFVLRLSRAMPIKKWGMQTNEWINDGMAFFVKLLSWVCGLSLMQLSAGGNNALIHTQ